MNDTSEDMPAGSYACMSESTGTLSRRRPPITSARRRELLTLASSTADHIQGKIEGHELRLFRHMLDLILDT